jgi:hypothetical protein
MTYIDLNYFAIGILDRRVIGFDPHVLDELSYRRRSTVSAAAANWRAMRSSEWCVPVKQLFPTPPISQKRSISEEMI